MTAAILLPSRDYLRERFHYDPETGILTHKPRPRSWFFSENLFRAWNGRCANKQAGTPVVMTDGGTYLQTGIDGKHVLVHRVIWKWMTDEDPDQVDHWDGDGTNNRWANLRNATDSQNKCNKPGNGILPKGVAPTRNGLRWYAKIQVGRKQTYLGTFDTPEAAYAAYCKAAAELHGEFARLE